MKKQKAESGASHFAAQIGHFRTFSDTFAPGHSRPIDASCWFDGTYSDRSNPASDGAPDEPAAGACFARFEF